MSSISMDKQYRLRNGWEYRMLCNDAGGDYPIVGMVRRQSADDFEVVRHRIDGVYVDSNCQSPFDLIEVKPQFRVERWVNVYRRSEEDITIGRNLFEKKEAAMLVRGNDPDCLATKRIIIEGIEGEDDV